MMAPPKGSLWKKLLHVDSMHTDAEGVTDVHCAGFNETGVTLSISFNTKAFSLSAADNARASA